MKLFTQHILTMLFQVCLLAFAYKTNSQPQIQSVAPTSGAIGTTVTIKGSNFNPDKGKNMIFFGPVKTVPENATTTEIVVKVPAGACSGPISITTDHLIGISPSLFFITFPGDDILRPASFAEPIKISKQSSALHVFTNDVDGDGKEDIIVQHDVGFSVIPNASLNNNVSFSRPVDFPSIKASLGMQIADLDGDGKTDIVVSNWYENTLTIYRNTSEPGKFSFAPGFDIATERNPRELTINDFDGDGRMDIIVINSNAFTISLFHNEGANNDRAINFTLQESIPTNGLVSLFSDDLDGDNKPELCLSTVDLQVLRNISTKGKISFGETVNLPVGVLVSSLVSTDLDLDGKKDLVAANAHDSMVSIFHNIGTVGHINFEDRIDSSAAWSNTVLVSDFNGDGRPEIVTREYFNNIGIIQNNSLPGKLNFIPKIMYPLQGGANGFAQGDFDGDGKPDLVVVNSDLYVMRNLSKPGVARDTVIAPGKFKYQDPLGFVVGKPVTPIYPLRSIEPLAFNGVASSVTGDHLGNLYITDYKDHSVKKITASTNVVSTIATDLLFPKGICVDKENNVYVTDSKANSVKEISATGEITIIASGLNSPVGAEIDDNGNIYVADLNNGAIKKIDATTHAITPIVAFPVPRYFAVDGPGNIYYLQYPFQEVKMYSVSDGSIKTILTSSTWFTSIATDVFGNVFVLDNKGMDVKEIVAGTNHVITIAKGEYNSFDLGTDGIGNVFYVDLAGQVSKVVSPGTDVRFTVKPTLVPGLSINDSTGAISGTPYTRSQYVKYIVTAANLKGSVTDTVAIKITLLNAPGNFAYNKNNAFVQGQVISPLSTTFTQPGNISVVGSNIFQPQSGTVDAKHNVYVLQKGATKVTKIDALTGNISGLGSGLINPVDISIDTSGNIYVADAGDQTIKKITVSTGQTNKVKAGFKDLRCIALDMPGNIFAADGMNGTVQKIAIPNARMTTIATGLKNTSDLAVDVEGNIYVANSANDTIKKIAVPDYQVTSIVGNFSGVSGITVDAAGNIFVADNGNTIKKILKANGTTTELGSGFSMAADVAVDFSGNVYICDEGNNAVKVIAGEGNSVSSYAISPALPRGLTLNPKTGKISGIPAIISPATKYTVTGTNPAGSVMTTLVIKVFQYAPADFTYSTPDVFIKNQPVQFLSPEFVSPNTVTTIATGFNNPSGIALDDSENIYIADTYNNRIQKIAGGTVINITSGFNAPTAIAIDIAGNIYVADKNNNAIKKISKTDGTVTSIGSGFSGPEGVAVDAAGNIYIADSKHNAVKKIEASDGSISTLGLGFNHPTGITIDIFGNVYVADQGNNAVKEISFSTGMTEILASGLNKPHSVTVDTAGNVFVTDTYNDAIKKIAVNTMQLTTIASNLHDPAGVALDGSGNVYVADTKSNSIKKISSTGGPAKLFTISPGLTPGLRINKFTGEISGNPATIADAITYTVTASNSAGSSSAKLVIKVTTFAPGNFKYNSPNQFIAGQSITPISPEPVPEGTVQTVKGGLEGPNGVAIDNRGNLYVAESGKTTITRIDATSKATTNLGYGFNHPEGIALDSAGNVYVADTYNSAVKKISASNGNVTTLGSGFNRPVAVTVDGTGNVFVADLYAGVKKINMSNNSVTKILSNYNFINPRAIAVDNKDEVLVIASQADAPEYNVVIKITPSGQTVVFESSLDEPRGLAQDAGNDLYVSYSNPKIVKRLSAYDGPLTFIGTEAQTAKGISVDAAGNVFLADSASNSVIKIIAKGGTANSYSIRPALPKGLSFNKKTGIISGTPAKIDTVTTYIVTATNSIGYCEDSIVISVVDKALIASTISLRSFDGGTIEWTTTTEKGIRQYKIEGSSNGKFFKPIATIPARNSSNKEVYAFSDRQTSTGIKYYRIEAINYDGTSNYSNLTEGKKTTDNFSITLYPNPIQAGAELHITCRNLSEGKYVLALYDMQGKLLTKEAMQHSGDILTRTINLPRTIAAGNYRLIIIDEKNTRYTKQLMIE
ncbi:FG-GAP-like repeat-containing protein [Danxiaibacter flavus]|uniref:FG-GAP-like repeat-containing protein n=1 Tax=Danxiaibacter flavus TaxID=3049108 RepID=A0ABV3ZHD5_9BACT|nr:FG-GAP-like repeat-containing protein [Chitinophagaceae bacterium DXS]